MRERDNPPRKNILIEHQRWAAFLVLAACSANITLHACGIERFLVFGPSLILSCSSARMFLGEPPGFRATYIELANSLLRARPVHDRSLHQEGP